MGGIFDKYPDLLDQSFVETYEFATCWTKINPDAHFDELDVAVALLTFRSNLAACSRVLGRSRRSLQGFVTRNPTLIELKEDIEETMLDDMESKYQSLALSGDDSALRFFLSTKAKNRGYTTRGEITGPDNGPISFEEAQQKKEELARKISTIASNITRAAESEPK